MAERPNQLWVADIPFLPTLAGFLYLAVVLDAWSRRIIGWAFSVDLKTRVVLDALDRALAARKPDDVVIIRIAVCKADSTGRRTG
jgi:putative transposase